MLIFCFQNVDFGVSKTFILVFPKRPFGRFQSVNFGVPRVLILDVVFGVHTLFCFEIVDREF